MDNLEFLDAPEGANEPVQPAEVPAEPVAEQEAQPEAPQRPRDEQGRFAPKEEPAAPVAVEPIAQPQPAEPKAAVPPGFVPIGVVKELRDEIRSLQRTPAAPAPMPEVPDPILDPQGFAQFQTDQFEQARFQDRLYFSAQLAESKYGSDTVKQAHEWGFQRCDTDPYFNARVRASQDPYSLVVQEYQREQIAAQVNPDEFKAYQAWKAAQATVQQAQPVAPPQPEPPTRSIASATSAGGAQHVAAGPGVAFDDTIK